MFKDWGRPFIIITFFADKEIKAQRLKVIYLDPYDRASIWSQVNLKSK